MKPGVNNEQEILFWNIPSNCTDPRCMIQWFIFFLLYQKPACSTFSPPLDGFVAFKLGVKTMKLLFKTTYVCCLFHKIYLRVSSLKYQIDLLPVAHKAIHNICKFSIPFKHLCWWTRALTLLAIPHFYTQHTTGNSMRYSFIPGSSPSGLGEDAASSQRAGVRTHSAVDVPTFCPVT